MDATQRKPAVVVTHAAGADRYENEDASYRVDDDGMLSISVSVPVVITEEQVAAINSPAQRAVYRSRIGETEQTKVPVAVYAPGHWHKVVVDHPEVCGAQ